ncbi:methyltransferase domain-containing protein [Ahrensia sp. R2A130]|uniref:methyltransferase domain-containing protein n=1 Tax=Ahrensia sp. R2A130 TaxID=744979 RepID=UPI0001E0E0E0|nr:methyltransferase domain-containing protein [Ahrensia sp. R2A130]EFL87954.1 probable methyltransferase C20orf7 [Ahrensia sp. R2A130]
MFDPNRQRLALERAARIALPGDDFLVARATQEMVERLGAVQRQFNHALALFGRTPALADALNNAENVGKVIRVERTAHHSIADHIADHDDLGLPEAEADLAIAPLTLHWSEDLPGQLVQIRRALKPDGLFLAMLPGPDTLKELRECLLQAESDIRGGAGQRVDPFTDIRDAGSLLQRAGFALPVLDREEVVVRYTSPLALITDLRRFGATNQLKTAKDNPPLSKAIVARMIELYLERFSDPDGRIRATFSFISLSGWVPHESQQKPSKPGSAKSRLADALAVPEEKLPR